MIHNDTHCTVLRCVSLIIHITPSSVAFMHWAIASVQCCTHPLHPSSEAKSQIAIVVAFFSLFTSFNLGTAIVAESLYGRVGNFSTASP